MDELPARVCFQYLRGREDLRPNQGTLDLEILEIECETFSTLSGASVYVMKRQPETFPKSNNVEGHCVAKLEVNPIGRIAPESIP